MKIVSTDKAPAAIGPYSQAIVTGGIYFRADPDRSSYWQRKRGLHCLPVGTGNGKFEGSIAGGGSRI